jgi:hypothetical protein
MAEKGDTVYVLMSLEGTSKKGKEWRPVAVVTNPDVATQWYEYGTNVDWVPLGLDEVSNIAPGETMPEFHPRETTSGEDKAIELSKQMEETITRLQGVINQQATIIKKLQKGQPKQQHNFQSSLLKEAGDNIPPKPMEGAQPFPDTLDAQGLADYIETYATYEVDNQQLYEMFQGGHAVLKLVPIASLTEGGRDSNLQSKSNEAKYLKQDLKTQPPAVVDKGKVLDGNHRLRANKRRGLTHMWCYVVMDGDYDQTDGSSNQEG